MKYHITREGKKIKLCDLELGHLKNILKWIEKKADEGITIRRGGGFTAEDMWYDEEELYGERALEYLNYYQYKAELNKRI